METFEFMSLLQTHGFPRLLGVATHLDYFRENKQKKKLKRELRKRFAIETPPESKLFFIKGMKNNLYNFKDVHNMARFISVIVPRSLPFKKEHPHLLVDRFELAGTQTGEQGQGKAKDVMVFGFLRGGDWVLDPTRQKVLLSGLGTVDYSEFKKVSDPCPVLVQSAAALRRKRLEVQIAMQQGTAIDAADQAILDNSNEFTRLGDRDKATTGEVKKKIARRGLQRYEKMVYAPQCDLGLTLFDETGDYVNIPDGHVVFTKRENADQEVEEHQTVKRVRSLQVGSQGARNQDQSDSEEEAVQLVEGLELESGNEGNFEEAHQSLSQFQKLLD